MDIYLFCILLGFVGLVAMAFSGLGHHGGGGHALGGHAHNSHLPGLGSHSANHSHALHGPHAPGAAHPLGQGAHPQAQSSHSLTTQARSESQGESALTGAVMAWVSPRALFSVLLGFGAVGILIHAFVHEPLLLVLAMVGGLGFEGLMLRPLWNLLLGFASKPARTLEDAVAEEARAVSDFDASGYGLIALDVDGQALQVLGSLRAADRDAGVRVRTGDILFVESVDTKRNSCVVSIVGSHRASG